MNPPFPPVTRHFHYYDNWEQIILHCADCDWSGAFKEGSVGYFNELMDSSCPRCPSGLPLAIVLYPTLDEMRANIDKPGVREELESWERSIEYFESRKLKTPEQLPEIDERQFELTWDFDEDRDKKSWTIISHRGVEILREPARWEGYPRYEQVAKILIAKYGARLKDLVPTSASRNWLWGDKLSAPEIIQATRKSLFDVDVQS
jgi:hypothetical protein